jgi:NHL repeat
MLRLTKNASISSLFAVLFCVVVLSFPTASLAQKVYTVTGGYVGDGGPATSASLAGPQFAAFDQAGNLYVSDYGHCRIRKVDTLGNISTAAGTGICGFSGDGGPAAKAKISFQLEWR